jgi:phosphohistidine phosphatase
MRHGEAVSGVADWQRPLSDRGRAQTTAMAQCARGRGVAVAWVYHSGILRAQQTAELVAAVLPPEQGVRQISGLCPDDDPFIIKAEVDTISQSVLLVSHLPFLSRLAGLMTTGETKRPVIEFAPATLVCLSRQANRWKFNWSVPAASS